MSGFRHPLQRKRYQILGGLLFAIGLPLVIRLAFDPRLILTDNLQITVMAAAVAHVAGYFVYRRLGAFPGVAATGAILPTFALTYGAVFLLIFFFRFDYSRFQAAGSFLMSVSWYFWLGPFTRRRTPYRLAIVPGGQVEQVRSIPRVAWHLLDAPNAPPGRVHGVVVDLRSNLSDDWERFIADCALAGIPVYHVKQIMESLTGRVAIEHLSENTLGSINPNMAYFALKGGLDRLGAAIVLLLLWPLLLLVALAIRLESPGLSMFRQERVGYRGKTFTVYKFRSMRDDVPEAKDAAEREQAITRDRDPRITRFGRFLRRTRIDELPQLLNVLRGEMSWIGPRPEAAVLSRWYQDELPFYRYRHIVKPGITGWAQVNQGHVAEINEVLEKLHYDFYYIKNFSPWLDIVITLRTIRIMLTGFGAR